MNEWMNDPSMLEVFKGWKGDGKELKRWQSERNQRHCECMLMRKRISEKSAFLSLRVRIIPAWQAVVSHHQKLGAGGNALLPQRLVSAHPQKRLEAIQNPHTWEAAPRRPRTDSETAHTEFQASSLVCRRNRGVAKHCEHSETWLGTRRLRRGDLSSITSLSMSSSLLVRSCGNRPENLIEL